MVGIDYPPYRFVLMIPQVHPLKFLPRHLSSRTMIRRSNRSSVLQMALSPCSSLYRMQRRKHNLFGHFLSLRAMTCTLSSCVSICEFKFIVWLNLNLIELTVLPSI